MNKPSEVIEQIAETCLNTIWNWNSGEYSKETCRTVLQSKIAHLLIDNDWSLVSRVTISRLYAKLDVMNRQTQILENEFKLHKVHQ